MERAGLALRYGLGRGIQTPCCMLSPVSNSYSPALLQNCCSTGDCNANMRFFASVRLARSLARTGTAIGPSQPPLVHRSMFTRGNRTTSSRNPQSRCVAQAADQASAAPAIAAPQDERPAEAGVSSEGTPGASTSKAGGYPFAEIEPKWQR